MELLNLENALENIAKETTDSGITITCEEMLSELQSDTIGIQEIVHQFSRYIHAIEYAHVFRKYLSNVLLAIVSTKIPLKPLFQKLESCKDDLHIHLEYSIILSALCDHPDVLQYALKYFEINTVAPFDAFIQQDDIYRRSPKRKRMVGYLDLNVNEQMVVECCYNLLKRMPNELSTKWDWSSFVNYFGGYRSSEIRWMVKECMAIVTNMTEIQSKIVSETLGIKQQDHLRNLIKQPVSIHPMKEINKDDVNMDSVINIDGILLPLYDEGEYEKGDLVPVKSTVNNSRSLALAVASGQALSLVGPVGSGKTSLVENLATITGRKGIAFKKVQLGDQTDSRMLLGSHQCTDVPGEFVWRAGVLTKAVQNGHWLLLEDIDSAALDVASTLSSLLERNTLCVPGYCDALPVKPGFQLFVTQRTLITNYGFQKKMSNSSTLLQKHLTQIIVEPLSRLELSEVIQNLYPTLSTIIPRIIKVFMMFSVGSHDTSLQATEKPTEQVNIIRGSRLISTRDLLKWCSRSVEGYSVSSPESALKVLQDALDIFTASVPSPEDRLELSKKICTCLGIVDTKSEFYCKHYKPNVSLNPDNLKVGRTSVSRVEKTLESVDFDNKQVVFSFTRQSACLLERIACCVNSSEPVLLVGETGTGKTSSVQYLARLTGHKLIVINMNQQSDSADLLGGYKPVEIKYVARSIRLEFLELFKRHYNVERNKKFLGHIERCYMTEDWTALIKLMNTSSTAAVKRFKAKNQMKLMEQWVAFNYKVAKLEQQVKASRLTFAFMEGSLVKAMQKGHWVLLDEINLASAEILECLAGLLEGKNESIELLEKGDGVPIQRHPDFTLFACMNPATDVGKKDLPVGLRNRFTEFFIDELTERNDLMQLIGDYLYHMNLGSSTLEAIYFFYSNLRKVAKLTLVDGSGNTPHYSLRTLCRALTVAAKAKCGTVARSLYEAFCLSFLTQLDSSSHPVVEAMIAKAVIGDKDIKAVLNQMIPEPPHTDSQNYLLFEGHWIPQGKLDINIPEGYILTHTVRKNLRDIARIISLGRLPVLLQGDTSVGKTSLITYIAKASGNYCVRINNHEHTDLQEYIGSYANDADGKLVFKEGVLVEAMRKGHWIILDELNLAPSDVLEALNRVLDDNRELFIPETQQLIKADPNFMLFATQNPPGLYGGRKMLSRAFRNRFVELHFDEIPKKELETILHQRCHVPPAYSKKMINVMAELQIRRRGSAAVQGKDGFITLRDLFRWGQRYKHASQESLTEDKFYDWDQHIADEGYLILAGKVRKTDERKIIEEVFLKHIKRSVNPENLFSLHQTTSPVTKSILEMILNNQMEEFSHIVWTYNMRRLAVLIAKAFNFNEPVLLVGETGCGKTTICQVLAALKKQQLMSVNCHMHTESSDFLGGLRPVRQYNNDGRLFEWANGPLIKAMQSGDMFLADEISLADDSVLERLNSLLEPERQLVLAERGVEDNSDIVVITAESNFHFIGTMNPGGDFGKKELSPALRNRFTEIWCDSVTSRDDLLKVLEKSVSEGISLENQEDGSSGIGNAILDFIDWLKSFEAANKFPFSIRDLLSWVNFINSTVSKRLLETPEAYVHGACMTFLDCFGTALTGHIDSQTLVLLRSNAINFLLNQIKGNGSEYAENLRIMLSKTNTKFRAEADETKFGIKPFFVNVGQEKYLKKRKEKRFTFSAPTTGLNTLRLLRGLQLNKAILLEGNPGVGKTSLVTALAKYSGHKVVRINLSDQTDITDLFGTDLPTEDGSFTFKEGAFLNALQNGDWILLDELNLAPQPVLEGLNACLDHRGEVYIPELGRTFKVKEQTKLFACQNPLKQGGARRGLPLSFLNRFTQVYIDTLTRRDLMHIVESQYRNIPEDILQRIVNFHCQVAHEITELQSWAHKGSPWEINLRDIQRWCEALVQDQNDNRKLSPGKFVDMLYVNRMRTLEDKERMIKTYDKIFHPVYPRSHSSPQFSISDAEIIFGDVIIERNVEKGYQNHRPIKTVSNLQLLRTQLPSLKSVAQCVKMNWLTILVGPTATGKSSIVQVLADLTGNDLQVVPVTSAMDVSDLLGGFEQVNYNRSLDSIYEKIRALTIQTVRNMWIKSEYQCWKTNELMTQLHSYDSLTGGNDVMSFMKKVSFLRRHYVTLNSCNEPFSAISKKLHEAYEKLNKLSTKVSLAKSINAGGKFEWVDSLLVKTLIEGSWLLLDNVNLTSAAILDRLNALLEPNGVLSIPERGDMCDLKPHPNFRVFFTMDPKYGEISRAMRNRGVEVFLLGDEWNTTLSDTMTSFDLKALLSSCGLPCEYHELVVTCHELMTRYVQGLERPTLSHLLQAAHLFWQQILRGLPKDVALVSSFSDVYIKPRSGADFASDISMSLAENKIDMLKKLEVKIQETPIEISGIKDSSHTLKVQGLCTDSSFEVAKQIAFPVIQEAAVERSSKTHSQVLCVVFNAYQKCPKELLDFCYNILDIYMEQPSYSSSDSKDLTVILNKELCMYISKTEKSMTGYKKFYPELYNLSNEESAALNVEEVSLFYQLGVILSAEYPERLNTSLSYSKAVELGMTDEFFEYPILRNCAPYLVTIDNHIVRAISNARQLDDASACKVIQLLNWRRRFLLLTLEPMIVVSEKKQHLREDIVSLLVIHCKWLQKYLMEELFKQWPDQRVFNSFKSHVNKMINQDDQDNTEMMKVSKKLKKMYGQPKLYRDQEEYFQSVLRTILYEKITLDMNQPLSKQLNKISANAASVSDVSLAYDIPDMNIINLIDEKLPTVLVKTENTLSEGMIIPISSYVIQRVLSLLRMAFLDILMDVSEGIQSTDDVTLLSELVQISKISKGFPPAFLNVLEVILNFVEIQDSQRLLTSVSSKFWEEFYKATTSSPAFHPLPFLCLDKPLPEDSLADIPSTSKRLSGNLPLMPYYVHKFTVTENADCRHLLAYKTVSLENRENYSNQLTTILNIIWKNIAVIDSAALLKINTDASFEMKKHERLIYCLCSIASQRLEIIGTGKEKETFQLLKDHFKENPEISNRLSDAQTICTELQKELSNNEMNTLKVKILTAELSILTSLSFVRVMAEINPVDHVERYRLKLKYIEEDIEIFDALLSNYYFHGLMSGSIINTMNIEKPSDVTSEMYRSEQARACLKKVHPYCAVMLDLKEETANRITKYSLENTFRPKEPSYGSFVKDCKHFTKSVLSEKTTNDISIKIVKTCTTLFEYLQNNDKNQTVISNAHNVVKETSSWLYSIQAFYKRIVSTYSDSFPDLAKPLQSSLSQIIHSFTVTIDLIKEIIVKIEQGPIWKEVKDLIQYPIEIPKRNEREEFLNRFVNPKFMNLLKRNTMAGNEDGYLAEIEHIEVLKMNLTELRMHCTAKDDIDKPCRDAMVTTLNDIYKAWEKQQRDIEKKKQDDEALYVTKSKCEDEDEEAIAVEEIQEMFPSYCDNDFGEFKPTSLEQKPVKKTQNTNKINLLISNEDISLVYKWHSNFVRTVTSAEWLPSKKKLVSNDIISSFLQRYPVFSRVIQNAWEALDADVEGTITPSLMVLISQIKDKIDGLYSTTKIDFYKSPWVSETKLIGPLLLNARIAVEELLKLWPNFPTLKEIEIIINRILSFPVTSPISRFLTGLELLLDKVEEWNKNAHNGNDMISISTAVLAQVMDWRKLEMAHWKECLNNLYLRKQSEAHKYWFFIYSVINDHLESLETDTKAEAAKVTEALKNFMETSNLAEYEVRLDIIYVYHCHLVHLEHSYRRDELLSILWNTFNYYSQFSAQVASHLKEKRAPIEKKLRDFVKICSWDRELSYWSVKDTVDKAHKALYKHTKEFENVLKESVSSCLVDSGSESTEHVGIWDRPKRASTSAPTGGAYMIDPTNHIVFARNVKKYLDEVDQPSPVVSEGSLLSKVGHLLNKAKTLCKDTITNSGYPALVQALDDFVTMVIENSTHLGSLEVDASLPKEKQTSQAKNIVQQKRKALADLFKYLSKMGLNYRTGLVIVAAANGELYDFTIPPVDLDAAMNYLKPRRCDASLTMLWSGCEKYFQKNIARYRQLSAALQSPHQDLGIQNIERCKGFAAYLLQLTNTQKKSISKYSRRLCDLRTLTTNLMNALEVNEDSNISTAQQKFDTLTECYANASIVLEQFSLVLKSCPEEPSENLEPDFDSAISDSKTVRCFKNSEDWNQFHKEVKTLISDIDKQKNVLQKAARTMPQKIYSNKNLPFICQKYIETIEDSRSDLELITSDLDKLITEFQIKYKTLISYSEPKHPLLRSIVELSAYLKETTKEIEKLDENNDVSMEESSDELISQTEDLIATLLLVIQAVYKKHLPQENENKDVFNAIDDFLGEKVPEEPKDILEDKHLRELLQDKITSDTRTLQLDALVSKVRKLLVNYIQYLAVKGKDVGVVKSAVMRLVPILEQTVLFVQYFVTQKVAVHRVSCKMLSVLLKIFSDLATKGFCKPSDLDMEEGDGEGGPGKLSSGTGLGDGEGQKDVSDRIENQDQLDDAHRPGEEKKEEERDCKEEEKGVNMTDDFDSHLQDVDNKEGEDSDEEDEEDNIDKQMGETDNAAEKLDQQIWGNEDEEPDESERKEKEDKGPGQSTGEKEMAAKDQEEGTDDGSDGKEKKQKKDINEMEKPEIDDDHVDPYHGNQQPLPEPEDFEMPENMDIDDNEGDDNDGETETENPFEIDVMKDTVAEEEEKKDKEEKKDISLSSDEEDGNEEGAKEDGANEETDEKDKNDETQPDELDDQNPKESDEQDEPQTEEEIPEESKSEELPKSKEDITEEDKLEEKSHETNPQANPSSDDPSAENRAENAEMNRGTNDNVETNAEQAKDEDAAPFEQAQEQVGEEKQSTGRSELDKSDKGHRGEKQAASRADALQQKQKHENKPGITDQQRTLGDINEKKHKQTHTLNVERDDETAEDGGGPENKDKEADAFQHVKQAKNDDLQAVDAATKEQAEQQPTIQQEDEDAEEMKEDEQVPMEVDDEDIQVEKSDELKPEKVKDGVEKDKEKSGNKKEGSDEPTGETAVEVEGEKVETEQVARGSETTYHTRLDEKPQSRPEEMTVEQYMSIREYLTTRPQGNVSSDVWRSLWQKSGGAARDLCERLRLVLEPTLSSRRAGDFRSGRAINMRRVIPYIASQFRKDRIWLRRTKPAKREYKIAIAIDDSSSMADNRSKELAFESLALVSQALNLLESGELAVLSFGEKPTLLHPFTEQFSEHSGAKILEQLRFEQTKTKIAQLLDFCTVMFEEQTVRSNAPNAKLLVIVGDGRNIFAEGEMNVIRAVRRARQQGIFLVYVVIDNPDNRDSIMDIRKPVMDTVTNQLRFISYLDAFPFAFYLILRDISALPNVLGDALRQWFELAANTT